MSAEFNSKDVVASCYPAKFLLGEMPILCLVGRSVNRISFPPLNFIHLPSISPLIASALVTNSAKQAVRVEPRANTVHSG